jgi:predicted neutral ceramidase superfamily lipid hydrolase
VREGGYEVNGFQSLFGLSGRFDQSRIHDAVTGCVRSAVDDLDRVDEGAVSRAGTG